MHRPRLTNREFEILMREHIDRRGAWLLSENARWAGSVPEHTDRAAEKAFRTLSACAAAGAPLPVPSVLARSAKAAAVGAGIKALAVTLAASAVIGAGAYAAAPKVHELLGAAHSVTANARHLAPADYVIPDPGGDFTLTDEGASNKMAYRWFGSPEQELIVEIAYALPDEAVQDEKIEVMNAGSMWGTVSEAEHTQLLILRDGDVFIVIEYFNAGREELAAYAEAFAQANE